LHLTHTGDARQPVLDVEQRVIAQIGHVVAIIGRKKMHDHRQVGRTFYGRDAELAHDGR
jgi:hypothetical protein